MADRIIITGAGTAQVSEIVQALGQVREPPSDVPRPLKVTRSVSANRTTSVMYRNTFSGPMWIGISLSLSSPGADGAHLQIGGVDVAHGDANANIHFFMMGVANPNESYILTASGGANIQHWVEYAL